MTRDVVSGWFTKLLHPWNTCYFLGEFLRYIIMHFIGRPQSCGSTGLRGNAGIKQMFRPSRCLKKAWKNIQLPSICWGSQKRNKKGLSVLFGTVSLCDSGGGMTRYDHLVSHAQTNEQTNKQTNSFCQIIHSECSHLNDWLHHLQLDHERMSIYPSHCTIPICQKAILVGFTYSTLRHLSCWIWPDGTTHPMTPRDRDLRESKKVGSFSHLDKACHWKGTMLLIGSCRTTMLRHKERYRVRGARLINTLSDNVEFHHEKSIEQKRLLSICIKFQNSFALVDGDPTPP